MKTNIFRIGKKSLSLIVVMMLVISTMLVGMVSVNAAYTANQKIYFNSGNSSSWWKNKQDNVDTATYIKFYQNGTPNFAWVKMTEDANGYYSAAVPSSGTYDRMLFVRAKTSLATNLNWDTNNILNYSGDISDTAMGSNNCFTVSSSSGTTITGTWSTYWKIGGQGVSGEWNADKAKPLTPVDGSTNLYSIQLESINEWFGFYNGSDQYGPSDTENLSNDKSTANTIAKSTKAFQNLKNSSDKNVTIYLDDSNSNSIKVWYETASTPSTTYYLGGRIKQTANNSDWLDSSHTDYQFVATETPGLYKYESSQTAASWSEKRNNYPQYFFVHTGSGKPWYGSDNKNDSDAATLTAANQSISLKEYASNVSTAVTLLTYIDSTDATGNVIFYLDTRNGMSLYYATASTPAPTYSVTKGTETNGTFDVSPKSAKENATITVTTAPNDNYIVKSVTYTPDGGSPVSVSAVSDIENKYTFAMPAANVEVNVEFELVTPSVLSKPTAKVYAADGKTEISTVEAGSAFVIKATSSNSGVVYRLYKDGAQVGTDQSDGTFEIATDETMIDSTLTYTVTAVLNGKESDPSDPVSVTVGEKAGIKDVRIWFKSSSATAYVPSFAIDNGTAAVMSRDKKTSTDNGTYFGETFSGSLKFYWYYTDVTLDTSVAHKISFTTRGFRVNATDTYTFGAENNYYFAVNNIMGDTKLIDLTGKAEYIRNYHISATHMVFSEITDQGVGFTWVNNTEYPMGTYLEENPSALASLNALTSATNLLTIPSALTPTAMLKASATPPFFTVKSATLAQKISAEISQVSELQYQLLDVNLDGVVDVRDSTMMQKALVYA